MREITPYNLHSLSLSLSILIPSVHFPFSSNFLCSPLSLQHLQSSFFFCDARQAPTWNSEHWFPTVPLGPIFPAWTSQELYTMFPRRREGRNVCVRRGLHPRALDITSFRLLHRIDRRLRPTGQHPHRGLSFARSRWPRISVNLSTDSMSLYNRRCSIVCDQWSTANRWITDDDMYLCFTAVISLGLISSGLIYQGKSLGIWYNSFRL